MNQPVNILVVEDDANVSTVLCARLESLGHRVVATAASGLEALDMLRQAAEAHFNMLRVWAGFSDTIPTWSPWISFWKAK